LALAGNLNLIDQVPQVQGFFSLYCRQFIELDALLKQAENRSNGGLLDLVGVTQTTKPGSDFDWVYRPGAESWVSIPKQVRVCGAEESRAALLQEDYRPADVAWVDSGDISESVPSTEIKGRVSQGAFSTQSLQLQLEMDEAGLVRIAQMHYPYWRASVDGRNTEVLQVDLGLQAVWVPEGRHLLELRYRDNLFLLGLLFSLASAGLCWLKTQPLARKSRRLNLSS
jgi:hypothetical protein